MTSADRKNRARNHNRDRCGRLPRFLRTPLNSLFQGLICGFWISCGGADVAAFDEETTQEVSTAVQIVARRRDEDSPREISGIIEDISGQTLVLRRAVSDVEVYSLRNVSKIEFRRSREFEAGLRKLIAHDDLQAISLLQSAAQLESRKWVVREINGALARACVNARRFDDAMKAIELILESDPGSRHVVELPLVWDERLPEAARVQTDLSQLEAGSDARRLVSASAHLHEPANRERCIKVLRSLQKSSNATIQALAETQLWRIKLLDRTQLHSGDVHMWHRQLQRHDRRVRSGPEFLCGRAHLLLNEHDQAATSLLWMPMVEPLSPELCQASLTDAAFALESSGRRHEADRVRSLASVIQNSR